MKLSDLKTGESGVILRLLGHGAFRKRVIEMGFVKGQTITAVLNAPLKDPIKYSIMGYELSLRRSEAEMVEIEPLSPGYEPKDNVKPLEKVSVDSYYGRTEYNISTTINIALIGNPNCGKTTLFNSAAGAHEHVGNYSGVTVDAKIGHFDYQGYKFNIVDLPGTYSLSCYSPEELYVRRYLRDETPDVIVNVVSASNLERNLYLTTELIDMDRPMVIALNMYDELEQSGATLDYKLLGEMIGIPVVPIVSKLNMGIDNLLNAVIDVNERRHSSMRHVHVTMSSGIEAAINEVKSEIKKDDTIKPYFSPRYLAIKLLERDEETEQFLSTARNYDKIIEQRDISLGKALNSYADDSNDLSSIIAQEKYGFIAGALAETYIPPAKLKENSTKIIDAIVTNKLFGFPIFIFIMWLMFWCTFVLGSYPMSWIESGVELLSSLVLEYLPSGPLKDLIADGIIGGVGGVIVFLPNIMILFFFVSFLEDSGYMARAAFIMDKIMHHIGLHGKSFIPLVMGFGCNVPAIIATRTIESRSSRIITILINPFISCSGRLPVYVLLVGIFFPNHASIVILGLYLLGIVVAVFTAKLLRKYWFKADETPFVMELPPYRLPTFKSSVVHMWTKGEQYLKKMGGIILLASVIVWALNYFPVRTTEPSTPMPLDDSQIDPSRDSYLEMLGKVVNPVMEPLGFNWRSTVAVIAGAPAKEIVVSTLGVLYTGREDIDDKTLSTRLVMTNPATGLPYFNAACALSLMVFVLLYFPCTATGTAIARETGSWWYSLFSIVYNTIAAWCVAFIVYRIALLLI